MKRFFSLLTVFVLAFSLAVPVGATDSEEILLYPNSINGITLELPCTQEDFTESLNVYYVYLARHVGLGSYKLFFFNEEPTIRRNGIDTEFIYLGTSNGAYDVIKCDKDGKFIDIESHSLENGDVVSTSNYSVIWANVSYETSYCDGTSCPATDVNFDDICDDCGQPLAYNLRVTPNTYEVVVKHSDSLTVKYSYTETLAGTSFDAVYNDNRITVSFDNPVNHYQYKLVDGEWTDYASYPNQYGTHTISLSGDASIIASDMDIYDSNGDLFFQNPLWMTVEKVTQGEMEKLTSETAGTMKTLVVCGVGLMACLMALSLFGKRWFLFLR